MRTYSAEVLAAFASKKLAIAQLIYVQTYAGHPNVYVNTSDWDFEFGGNTYAGSAGLVQVNVITSEYGELPSVEFVMLAQTSAVSLALVDSQYMRGKRCEIRTAVINSETGKLLDAPLEWVGLVDTFSIEMAKESAQVGVTCETAAIDLLRPSSLKYTNDDQKRTHSWDRGFEFVKNSDTTVIWPSAKWGRK